MGYSGGTKQHPTYHDLGDHMETIQIDYDPSKVTYEQLLSVFWDKEYAAIYPGARDLVASTATARVNGYAGGYGTLANLQVELAGLGLSEAGQKRLQAMVAAYEPRRPGGSCPIK